MNVEWETVEVVGTEEEAALIRGFLHSQGISAEIESLLFHQEPVNFGHLGEIRIRVPGEQVDEARKLLEDLREGRVEGLPEDVLREVEEPQEPE